MRTALSAILIAAAILDGVLGFRFLSDPAGIGREFGLNADGAMGLSAMRADFTAFFIVAAVFMAFGAWKKRGDVLVAPLLLFLIALTGRALNLLVVGSYPGWWQPMAVEAAHVAVLTAAIASFGWRGRTGR